MLMYNPRLGLVTMTKLVLMYNPRLGLGTRRAFLAELVRHKSFKAAEEVNKALSALFEGGTLIYQVGLKWSPLVITYSPGQSKVVTIGNHIFTRSV